MSQEIKDPLVWNCPSTKTQDWENVPETSTQITLYLQNHLASVVHYLKTFAGIETTAQLRTAMTERITVSYPLLSHTLQAFESSVKQY